MTLKELLEQHPEAKKEYETQIECLNHAGVVIIEEQAKWIEKLEDMIIMEASREVMLMEIDNRYWYTIRMQEEGLLRDNENWYDQYLERQE